MSSATTTVANDDDGNGGGPAESLRRRPKQRNKFHPDITTALSGARNQNNASGTEATEPAERKPRRAIKRKRRSTAKPEGKSTKDQPQQNSSSADNPEQRDAELQRLRNSRLKYLRSRMSRIHLESSESPEKSSSDDGSGHESPFLGPKESEVTTATTDTESQSPLNEKRPAKSRQSRGRPRRPKETANSKKSISPSNSRMPSLEPQDTTVQQLPDSEQQQRPAVVSGILEVVGKRGRKIPLRHRDFVSESEDDELNMKSGHVSRIDCSLSGESHPDNKGKMYYCDSCPSYFTTRRGIANHCKLHGANKRFKCDLCDFSCDNYKTSHLHKEFHSAINKSYEQLEQVATDEKNEAMKQEAIGTHETDDKTDVKASPNQEYACNKCPFVSRDQKRLEAHFAGHRRTRGFKCSLCSYMSESAGFLKRHCQLHKPQNYKWPPTYVGVRQLHIVTKDDGAALNSTDKICTESDENLNSHNGRRQQQQADTSAERNISITTANTVPKKRFQKRYPGNYLCGFCGRHFKTYDARLLHRIINHSIHIAKETYKLLRMERLNVCRNNGGAEGFVETTSEETMKNSDNLSAENLHRCSHCPFTCSQKSRLLRHEDKHFVKAEHQCTHCTFSCRSTVILEQHLRLHQKPVKLLQMPGRPREPVHVDERGAATASSKVEKCSECPYTTRHTCDMRAHAQMHIGRREFACTKCSYSTKRAHILNAHLQLHFAEQHNAISNATSNNINSGQDTKNQSTLRRHDKIVGDGSGHQRGRVYTCRWCPYRTQMCSKLFIHYRNHRSRGLLRCEKCPFSTSTEMKLREHMKMHLSEKTTAATAKLPSKSAPAATAKAANGISNGNGSSRVKRQPNGEYCCQECPFSSSNYGKFWNHKQKHKKPSRYQCDLCSYSAGSSFCVVKHRQTHLNQNGGGDDECGATKMEEFIVMKEEDLEMECEAKNAASRKRAEKEEPKNDENSPDILQVNCPKDGQTYKFNLSRIARKLPPIRFRKDKSKEPSPPSNLLRCKECPYFGSDELLFNIHESLHVGRRQYRCNICSFSSQCPETLHQHLNLHLPPASPRSASKNRKQLLKRRFYQSPETINPNCEFFQCTSCNYRTAHEDRFQEHRLEHTRNMQQRLTTAIKRSAQCSARLEKPKVRRPERRTDRQYHCGKCSFRCDTPIAYNTHIEKHGAKSFFTCGVCDYSSETKNVVEFHLANHHLDVPISFFYKKAITNPEESQELRCRRCKNYKTFRVEDFADHWEKVHCSADQNPSPDDLQIVEELRLGLLRVSWIKRVEESEESSDES